MFSNYNGMKQEISNRKIFGKFTNRWKLNKTFLKTNKSKKKAQRRLESNLRWLKTKHNTP